MHGKLIKKLRYGENPHQKSYLYDVEDKSGLKKIHGEDLSYNNYNDIYSALLVLDTLNKTDSVAIVKHANPCGVSTGKNQIESFKNAFRCDPLSAFGGVIAIDSMVTKKLALELLKHLIE